jgi:hypothetical protein
MLFEMHMDNEYDVWSLQRKGREPAQEVNLGNIVTKTVAPTRERERQVCGREIDAQKSMACVGLAL